MAVSEDPMIRVKVTEHGATVTGSKVEGRVNLAWGDCVLVYDDDKQLIMNLSLDARTLPRRPWWRRWFR